jgi:hypothetical protein
VSPTSRWLRSIQTQNNSYAVDARPFWRDKEPGAGVHPYNGNAETHYLVGNALGWTMADLLENQK